MIVYKYIFYSNFTCIPIGCSWTKYEAIIKCNSSVSLSRIMNFFLPIKIFSDNLINQEVFIYIFVYGKL